MSKEASKTEASEKGDVPVIRATFSEFLAGQIDAYPHKDTYESALEDLKWTTQQLNAHAYGVTGGLHPYRSKSKNGYTVASGLRAEVLVGLLGAPKAGVLFSSIPPFRKEEMMYDRLECSE